MKEQNADGFAPLQVEKQEKPKQPKGRALKRVKYTRRFVNVTMTGGKRKMNPNPGN
jgi:small subunit ribosomal protein S30e